MYAKCNFAFVSKFVFMLIVILSTRFGKISLFLFFFPFIFSRFSSFRHILYRLSGPILHRLMREKFCCVRFDGGELQQFFYSCEFFPNSVSAQTFF